MTPKAFLIWKNRRYSSRAHEKQPLLYTPVTALIEGIWNQFPSDAHAILRNHIQVNYPLTPACAGMLKVAGKRSQHLPMDIFERQISDGTLEEVEVTPVHPAEFNLPRVKVGQRLTPSEAAAFTLDLRRKAPQGASRAYSSRAVGALLLDPEEKVLAYAWNTNALNKTLHAELNLVKQFVSTHQKKIPAKSTLWISLKPCAMCAAQIFSAMEAPANTQIIYLEDDPGPLSKNSILMVGSDLWKRAGGPIVNLSSEPLLLGQKSR